MKKWLFITLTLFVLILSACNKPDPKIKQTAVQIQELKFTGTILVIEDKSAILTIDEGELLSSGTKVRMDLSVNKKETFSEGDKVEVTYDGVVRETYPLDINTISVKKAK